MRLVAERRCINATPAGLEFYAGIMAIYRGI